MHDYRAPLTCPDTRCVRQRKLSLRCGFTVIAMIIRIYSLSIAISALAANVNATLAPGKIVFRFDATTASAVNYYTCQELALKYSITVQNLLELNPTLEKECRRLVQHVGSEFDFGELSRGYATFGSQLCTTVTRLEMNDSTVSTSMESMVIVVCFMCVMLNACVSKHGRI